MWKALFLAIFPSILQVPLRKLLGQRVGDGTKIKFGSIVAADDTEIGAQVTIGPFTYIRAKKLNIGAHSVIKPFSAMSTHHINLGQYTRIAPTVVVLGNMNPKATFRLGDHSSIFPFCWLEPGEGIDIGKDVGLGGHGLIFTHGSWPDYVNGGPVQFGPVRIQDNVWLPWRVTILPGVVIGKGAVIGANSLVNKSIPESTLAAGSPAKVLKQNTSVQPDLVDRETRMSEVIEKFDEYLQVQSSVTTNQGSLAKSKENSQYRVTMNQDQLKPGDLFVSVREDLPANEIAELCRNEVSVLDHNNQAIYRGRNFPSFVNEFVSFVRIYGIRLYVHDCN